MRKIAHWLFTNQYLEDASSGRPLLPEPLYKPDGTKYSNEKISNNLYVFLHCGNIGMLNNIQKLLKNVNYKPNEFRITFKQR